ncbi:membrane protein insertion efficiency factor YidD [Nodosilinea sp. E11]|uniref:membrane protein insertion efficiency factor YidD n=1 Tax=Nodosilinea sp. E11 TaxID=3037479 RepID=UPI0029351265|nr:membrane protein insertion efficiency factor YidD [Nodosilinea sp. E11]WOD39686.1 membrane protein insertion efficiency factor YidD [Nodosilinea sp. E11]
MQTLLTTLIRGYRAFLSPLLPSVCRFTPTCSQYALDAINCHGAWQGSWLALRRILRCHPFHPGGYDPVPDVFWTVDTMPLSRAIKQSAQAKSRRQRAAPKP